MSRIRNRDTNPELIVRKFLHNGGFRYSLRNNSLPGKPDLVLRKYNTCIFIHGCFWHGHDHCKFFKIPETRRQWWKEKIHGNKIRDKKNINELINSGWNVITIWECELKSDRREPTLKNLKFKLRQNNGNTSY